MIRLMTQVRPGAGLEWENRVVLQLVEALLGLITPEMRGVAIEFDGDDLVVHVAVSETFDGLVADVEEVVAELEGGLWPSSPEVSSRVYVGSAANNGGWAGRQHRLVYLAKQ
jgi:hypothetical protein